MAEIQTRLDRLQSKLDEAHIYLQVDKCRAHLPQLETEMGRPDLWDDAERARGVQTEYTQVRDDIALWDSLASSIADVETLIELLKEEFDEALEIEAGALADDLEQQFTELELRALFTGQYDEGDAVCEVHSGAGGTDSQDWAEMLLHMYRKWAQRRGFGFEVTSVNEGQEAGITSAEFVVRGRNVYGWLQAERGVHRLVRISPFDSQARRHTAFASFSVVPYIEDATAQVDIDDKDLRVDVFRSSGAGGQHVNTTDSAVRITHLPTGLVVSCQNERSQHQNKERCMQMLAMKLVDLQRQQREEKLASEAGEAKKVEWGSQIRSYVLHPYQQVKDERSGLTSGNPEDILDGGVGTFMEAWLRWRRTNNLEDANV